MVSVCTKCDLGSKLLMQSMCVALGRMSFVDREATGGTGGWRKPAELRSKIHRASQCRECTVLSSGLTLNMTNDSRTAHGWYKRWRLGCSRARQV